MSHPGRASRSRPEYRPRPARPGDYDAIAAAIDGWWGRPVLAALPRLFLDHFHRSSLVVEESAGLVAFLIGILSPSDPRSAYIHFAGVAPTARRHGLARMLYAEFFAMARADGRSIVTAVTAPANSGSISFHESLGFAVTGPVPGYNGPGRDLIVFERPLGHTNAGDFP
ncbi:MAG TPA: GNAT family N-acetyltransferase [Streptosporangiaceae bacterium]|nr:GNAT family N-acetyltransferase [Streptosporangiaceae bacterium]